MKKLTKLPREENTGDGLPAEGGEGITWRVTDDDVQGHAKNAPDELGPRLPGTGGDYRRPTSGGEVVEDVEGHRQT